MWIFGSGIQPFCWTCDHSGNFDRGVSDEMFPIMISNAVPVVTIVKILTCKAVIGILSGLVLEYVYTHILKKQEPDVDIHEICEEERCHCEHGVISSAAFHTLKVLYTFS